MSTQTVGRTTIELLTGHLTRYGWPSFTVIESGPDGGKILTGWHSPLLDDSRMLFIELDHRSNTLMLVVPALTVAPQERMPIGQLADVLTALGFANFGLVFGRFAYDPSDGEIRYNVGVPVDHAEITFEQFAHVLNVAQGAVSYWAPRLQDVAGGKRTGGSVVESFIRHAKEYGVLR